MNPYKRNGSRNIMRLLCQHSSLSFIYSFFKKIEINNKSRTLNFHLLLFADITVSFIVFSLLPLREVSILRR